MPEQAPPIPPPKKPKLSKAERRALQEQQRAAKAERMGQKPANKQQPQQSKQPNKQPNKQPQQSKQTQQPPRNENNRLFAHLQPYVPAQERFTLGPTLQHKTNHNPNLHPLVVQLGYDYASFAIHGANERCRAMLACWKALLPDVIEPDTASGDPRLYLDAQIFKPSFSFWTQDCRPHSVTMGHAYTATKAHLAQQPRELPWTDRLDLLTHFWNTFQQERIEYAQHAIVKLLASKVQSGPVLVYGSSCCEVLKMWWQKHPPKELLVVVENTTTILDDLPPTTNVTLVPYAALSSTTTTASLVLLGAVSLLRDGRTLAPLGTASVALWAHKHRIPVLVAAETYKIGDASEEWELGPDGLVCDVTQAEYVSGVVTEWGLVPPSSVAVVLREMHAGVAAGGTS